jgi:replicative DNA helicase
MSNLIAKAQEYLNAQLSVIPTQENKLPAIASWKPYQSQRINEDQVGAIFSGNNVKGLAIICGAVSGGLEVIDVDTKYDVTGTLWDELSRLITDNLPDLSQSLVIAQTRSGGYHIYYKCESIAGNLKLSVRLNKDVLVETRGEGGYVIAPPTPGYTYLQGEPGTIPTITPEEREILFSIARSFNEVEEVNPRSESNSSSASYSSAGLSPFEDYNQRGDVIGLLESKGWRVTSLGGQRINLLRPGQTDSKTSGNFHTGLRTLRVFSSSTEFNPDKAYNPSQVFSLLECGGDNKLTYRRLLELGYGEPYKGETVEPTQVKTERITVEVVNKVTGNRSVLCSPGESLKIEDLRASVGGEAIITSPDSTAQEEVLKAIGLIQQTGKQIYTVEGGKELRDYTYILNAIFLKYGAIQEQSGGLTDRNRDSLLDEIIGASQQLQPVDKDIFLKEFISQEPIKELGISEESLSITVDRLTSTRDKEAQAKEFKKLLSEVTQLQDKGEVDKALKLLDSKVKEVKLQDKATEFSSLLVSITEGELRERLAKKPESLNSGFTIDGEELLLPAGAISVLAAPTSHGKTTFLINLALNVAQAYPEKEAYLFSYEEDGDSILINTLNTYLDSDISSNNRRTLKSYFATGSTEYIKAHSREYFTQKKNQFFQQLIDTRTLNIHYSSYDSDTLIDAIRYLHKNTNVGSVFIDYIQLLSLPTGKYKAYSRQEELKQICTDLKNVAVETGLPIVLGAQFNREVVNQLRLHSTKIGEAGDIERVAHLIVGFWNNNFKPMGASEGEINEINNKGASAPDTLYTTLLKNRGGRVGLEEILEFKGNTGKIKNSSSSGNNYFK